MMIASRSDGYSRYSHANSKRSMFRSFTRVGDCAVELSAVGVGGDPRLKARSPREPRPDSKQQLGQKRDHRPLHYHTPTRASSLIGFSGGTGTTGPRWPASP